MTALFVPADQAPVYGEVRPHPAKFNAAILAELARLIWLEAHRLRRAQRDVIVLDPFAGTGRLQWVARGPVKVLCFDLEPEWIGQAPDGGVRADATALPLPAESVDVVATSCTYANRMADLYDGRDGSRRHTYRIDLGRLPSPGSSCGMQWGPEYRTLHAAAWAAAWNALRPGVLIAVNVKDHQRYGAWQEVPQWHAAELARRGFDGLAPILVDVDGLRHGANWQDRAEHEQILLGRKPSTSSDDLRASDAPAVRGVPAGAHSGDGSGVGAPAGLPTGDVAGPGRPLSSPSPDTSDDGPGSPRPPAGSVISQSPAEDRVVDLMAALEESVAAAKAPRDLVREALDGAAPREPNGCILWPFSVAGGTGYPAVWHDGRMVRVQHLILDRFHGPRPSEAHTAGHAPHDICGSHLCIAPEHLSWQTPKEQHAQRIEDGTDPLVDRHGERNSRATVSDADVAIALERIRSGALQKTVADELGVSKQTVSDWVHGKRRTRSTSSGRGGAPGAAPSHHPRNRKEPLMDTTVPVLAVISGSTDMIRERRDVARMDLESDARCIGRSLIADASYVINDFWRDQLVKHTLQYDPVAAECRRRFVAALGLARADEGPQAWAWTL